MERRNTIQKELVHSAVIKMHRHVTADEVFQFIKTDHPSIGKGTVYRNLDILTEENKIRKVELPYGPNRYDFRVERHQHIQCVKCGSIYDVDMDEIKDIEKLIHDNQGMIYLDYDILFKGICPECQKKMKREETNE